MWTLKEKKIQMNLFPKQKETQRHRTQIYGYQRGKGAERRDKLGGWDQQIHTTMCKIDSQQGLTT